MKTNLLIILFFCLNAIYAQGNLQFNQVQVVRLDIPAGTSTPPCSCGVQTNFVVPANKVWKLESSPIDDNTGNQTFTKFRIFDSNGYDFGNNVVEKEYGGVFTVTNQVVWLPAGNYKYCYFLPCKYSNNSYAANTTKHAFTFLEFNIVP